MLFPVHSTIISLEAIILAQNSLNSETFCRNNPSSKTSEGTLTMISYALEHFIHIFKTCTDYISTCLMNHWHFDHIRPIERSVLGKIAHESGIASLNNWLSHNSYLAFFQSVHRLCSSDSHEPVCQTQEDQWRKSANE